MSRFNKNKPHTEHPPASLDATAVANLLDHADARDEEREAEDPIKAASASRSSESPTRESSMPSYSGSTMPPLESEKAGSQADLQRATGRMPVNQGSAPVTVNGQPATKDQERDVRAELERQRARTERTS